MEHIFESCFAKLGVPAHVVVDVTPAYEGNAIVSMHAGVSYAVMAAVVRNSSLRGDVVVVALDSRREEHKALAYGLNVTSIVEVDVEDEVPNLVDLIAHGRAESVLVIDSLSTLIHRQGAAYVAQRIVQLRKREKLGGLVSVYRSCEHDQAVRDAVSVLATTMISLHQNPAVSLLGDNKALIVGSSQVRVQVVRKRPSGRLAKYELRASLKDGLLHVDEVVKTTAEKPVAVPSTDPLQELEVSFNMNLTEEERRERSKVSLAYEHEDAALADTALDLHPKELGAGCYEDLEQDSEDDVDV